MCQLLQTDLSSHEQGLRDLEKILKNQHYSERKRSKENRHFETLNQRVGGSSPPRLTSFHHNESDRLQCLSLFLLWRKRVTFVSADLNPSSLRWRMITNGQSISLFCLLTPGFCCRLTPAARAYSLISVRSRSLTPSRFHLLLIPSPIWPQFSGWKFLSVEARLR